MEIKTFEFTEKSILFDDADTHVSTNMHTHVRRPLCEGGLVSELRGAEGSIHMKILGHV